MPTHISQIFRYPVKSMGGHALDEANLGEQGIPGDRCWAVKDEERGGIKGGKRFAALMKMQASLSSEPDADNPSPHGTITLPDGSQIGTDDPTVNLRLSEAVGNPLSLWPLVPKEQLDHYLRTANPGPEGEAAWREVFARTADEPLPDLSQFPPELLTYESPPGTYFDAYPLLILSQASLNSMQAASEEAQFDVRRFRPNIVLHTEDQGFPEEAWSGATATLGDATLKFEIACPRCVMTTHGFADLPKDPQIMRHLVKENDGNLGIYASVVSPGRIRIGDELKLVDT